MNIKKWIPVIIISLLAILSTICTLAEGFLAYLAVTGLDLLVTAKYELPRNTMILFIVSSVLWVADIIYLLIMILYKKLHAK